MRKSISCYIISETSLGIQCAIEFLKDGNKLLGIISNCEEVVRWAYQNGIFIISSISEFQKLNPYKKFDYLFSIVNTKILPKSVLELPKYYSINYHDSLLPSYAGVHATSWAIFNDEKTHGVSWHKMEETIDTGSILKQSAFPVKNNDTALNLNLECYVHAKLSFTELIRDLASGAVLEVPQNLNNKSYYARNQKPSNLGFVSWYSPAEDIERCFRALYFGDYSNALASFKVLLGDQIFIPTELKILNFKSQNLAAIITKITDKEIQVSTETHDVVLANFKTVNGDLITIEEIKQISGIYLGCSIQNLSEEVVKNLHEIFTDLSGVEQFWIENIVSAPAILTFMNQSSRLTNRTGEDKKYKKIVISNEKLLSQYLQCGDTLKEKYTFTEIMCTNQDLILQTL